jgi:hypothetical protein
VKNQLIIWFLVMYIEAWGLILVPYSVNTTYLPSQEPGFIGLLRIETYRISDLNKPNHQTKTHALSGNGHTRLRLTGASG